MKTVVSTSGSSFRLNGSWSGRATTRSARHKSLSTRAKGKLVETSSRPCANVSTRLDRVATQHRHCTESESHRTRRSSNRRNVVVKAAPAYTPTQWVAVALGYSCVVGSVFRCLPQIHRILTRKSVEGISFTAILAEFLIYSINLAYNVYYKYPFNTYGDLAVSWFVLIFVLVLMQWFRRFDAKRVVVVSVLSAVWCYTLFSQSLPAYILSWLQAASSVGLAFGSRIPQIWLNWQQGTTGELSIIMFIANALGCMIRVFTTLSLTGDTLLLFNAGFHFVLNAIIIAQCVDTRLKGSSTMRENLSGT